MFAMILTLMAAPVVTDTTSQVALIPETSITFSNTTAKKASADCERVRKALTTSGRIAFCIVGDTVEVADAE